MTLTRAVVVHGYLASPDANWFRWLARELAEDGIAVEIPELPDPADPDLETWTRVAVEAIGAPDPGTLVIGHSLGCITALRALDRAEGDWRLGALVLVSGFDREPPAIPELAAFTAEPLDLGALAARIPHRVVIASDEDEIVDPALSRGFAERLGATFIEVPGGGHFLGDQGFTEFPRLAEVVRGLG